MNQGKRWVLLMQKNRRRKSHAWAPLRLLYDTKPLIHLLLNPLVPTATFFYRFRLNFQGMLIMVYLEFHFFIFFLK